jgi:ribonucleoside-diphosphate reductase alpha chain
MRMRTANTAAYISDEFMKRVKARDSWYMFDPKETPDLIELYGEAFSKRYAEYCQMAEEGKMKLWKKMPAETLMRNMLVSMQGTSHPWQTWKDAFNLRALNNNTGTIHMSNLCTEIALPQDRDNIAVCNLASISLPAHLSGKSINWQKFEETIRVGIRHLDNLIDINLLPVAEARKSDQENRAVGLGLMGFADAMEKMGYSYDSEEAYNIADQVFEFLSYIAIDESAELAKVRGSYKNFAGSEWSKGLVPIDTLSRLERERGIELQIEKGSKHGGLNWDRLREKVKDEWGDLFKPLDEDD